MKKNRNLLICAFAIVTLTACGNNAEEVTKTYSVDEVTSISISTAAENVSIVTSDSAEIAVSLAGLQEDDCKVSEGILEIALPEGKAGIHFSAPALTVSLPAGYSADSIMVKSEAGNVSIDNIGFSSLSVSTASGNITTNGISGNVTANAKTGKFSTNFEDADTDSADNKFAGVIGDDSRTVNLVTEAGNITLE